MRVGIIALLQESNTFVSRPTELVDFERELLVTGPQVREAMADAHHEVGGFFSTLDKAGVEPVGIFAARALPGGAIAESAFDQLVEMLLAATEAAGPLDGVLVAPHGATVAMHQPDADGYWLTRLRSQLGPGIPILGTLDPHANLSPTMLAATNALIAYRTNPHVDQRQRGSEAAELMLRTLAGEIRPTQAAATPPVIFNIERQASEEPPAAEILREVDRVRQRPHVLSSSLLYGFPYADVCEMGAAVICVTDDRPGLAATLANEMADFVWARRQSLDGEFLSVDAALNQLEKLNGTVCLLDMGDNVGGGSPADGAVLCAELMRRQFGPAFVALCDPQAANAAHQAGAGQWISTEVGGKVDSLHGPPLAIQARVQSLHRGTFTEPQPRHGGFTRFDMGPTAIVQTANGLTVQLTTHRTVPWSLGQLTSCGLNPTRFRAIVAKGVNSPIAAYSEVCDHFLRVDTPGSTCANLKQLRYTQRRRPMFPFEPDVDTWHGGDL